MAYRDLREWLAQVEELGELKKISGVDRVDDMGAVYEILQARPDVPAILFDDIPGYPSGYRVAMPGVTPNARASTARISLTMGLPQEKNLVKLTDMVRHKITDIKPIPPKYVETGSILENVHMGDDIDLNEFPAPKWHELDGGYYIGTGDLVITRDPDDGWVNFGTYRVQVHDKNTLGFYVSPGKHARIIREKHFSRNEPCPVAMSFGHDPLLFMVACEFLPWGISEYDYAGGVKGHPLEVIKGPVTGLPIPADAEIVIEGESVPDKVRLEGPFGEFPGYYASGEREEPFIKVKSILHRNNPIIVGAPPLRPEGGAAQHIMRAATVWNGLERAGIPDIVGVGCYMTYFFTVVSIKQRYPGHSKQVATVASMLPGAAYCGRFVIVVDEDIDPTNFDEVLWALSTRCEPEMSINILNRCWSTPLDPMSRPGLVEDGLRCFSSRALIDACIPYELKTRKIFPPVVGTSPALREKVEAKYWDVLHY